MGRCGGTLQRGAGDRCLWHGVQGTSAFERAEGPNGPEEGFQQEVQKGVREEVSLPEKAFSP